MSNNNEIIEDFIKFIESSVKEGFKKEAFIKVFREKIDKFLAEKEL